MSIYLWINILIAIGLFLFYFKKLVPFHKQWKIALFSVFGIGGIFILWDIYFVKIDVWGFNVNSENGIFIFNLPIEKWLFSFSIPFLWLFIYEMIKTNLPNFRPIKTAYYFSFLFTVSAIVIALVYRDNYHTFTALLCAGLINWIVYFGYTPRWYPYFMISFLIIQVFSFSTQFLIDYLMQESLMWYDQEEIIGVNILSFPIENIYYNFLFFFSIVIVYEYLKLRQS